MYNVYDKWEMKLVQTLRDRLLAAAAKIAEPAVAKWSRHLAQAIQKIHTEPGTGKLYIPHYWAVYVNDGRPPASPERTTYFVWWRNPADDPRFSGSHTPARANQVRRLSRDEWRHYYSERRRQIKAGELPDMIIAKQVADVPPRKFFDNDGGMASFLLEANRIGQEVYRQFVRESMGELFDAKLTNEIRL